MVPPCGKLLLSEFSSANPMTMVRLVANKGYVQMGFVLAPKCELSDPLNKRRLILRRGLFFEIVPPSEELADLQPVKDRATIPIHRTPEGEGDHATDSSRHLFALKSLEIRS